MIFKMDNLAVVNFAAKKVVVFDLDGTLTESKMAMDAEMAGLLLELLKTRVVAVIGGGKYELFQTQLLDHLPHEDILKNLLIFPTTATACYQYSNG